MEAVLRPTPRLPAWRAKRLSLAAMLLALSLSCGLTQIAHAQLPGREPETLQQAWSMAIAIDPGLAAKRCNQVAAQSALLASRAERWPVGTTNAAYHIRDSTQYFRMPNQLLPGSITLFPFVPQDGFSFQATMGVPVYTSGRISQAIKASEAELQAAQWEVPRYILDLKMQTAAEYVAVLRAQQEVEVAEDQLRSRQARALEAKQQFERERLSRDELWESEVAVDAANHALLAAHNQLDAARAAYNRRIGRDLNAPVLVAPLERLPALADLTEATERAMQTRPELTQMSARIAALHHQAASLQAAACPQVELQGTYNYQENPFQYPEGIASAGIGVSWNVLDGGRIAHQANVVLREAEALAHLQEEQRSLIRLEVRQAWLAAAQAEQWLRVTQRALERADENLRITQRRYELGAITQRQLVDTESQHSARRRDLLNASLDNVLAGLLLRRAIGEL